MSKITIVVRVLLLSGLLLLAGCYADQGISKNSDIEGYKQYTNYTLNISILSPEDWTGNVGINGMYTLSAPTGIDGQIYVNSSYIKDLLAEAGGTSASTLDDYKNYEMSQLTPENAGPELKKSIKTTTMAGQPGWELNYSFNSSLDHKIMYVRKIFVLAGGRVYFLTLYTRKPVDTRINKVFETMKDSYQIL